MPHTQLWFYIQILYRTNTFTHNRFCAQTLLNTSTFEDRHFYTNTFTQRLFLHTNTFMHKHFYAQTRLHAKHFTHKLFYTQTLLHKTLLHRNTFRHRRFYTQTLSHTNTFTHNPFTHKHFYTQMLSHTGPFAQNHFYTETLLRTDSFTHRPLYTQTLWTQKFLHTNTFTHKHLYTQTLQPNSQKNLQFLTLKHHFVRKGCRRTNQSRKKLSAFDTRNPFRAKGLPPRMLNCEHLSYWHSNLISCDRVAAEVLNSQKHSQFLTHEPHAKGLPYRGASSALPAALRENRKRRRETVTEGKREREKMWRWEDVKMRRW